MDDFKQCDVGERDKSALVYKNAIHYKEKENAFIKRIISVVYFLLPLL